ncbi:hypothetical protein PBY51_013117 [Eleginops maclovinus]|uniref:Uncharacterized protein n=1 Tax=Eleginops maclovinus TaxID=56733 RepID=A0AAN7Y6Z7_ELEMC|nr:hypothetical protein PBY51_013117 [Eleginops maclovinus]
MNSAPLSSGCRRWNNTLEAGARRERRPGAAELPLRGRQTDDQLILAKRGVTTILSHTSGHRPEATEE